MRPGGAPAIDPRTARDLEAEVRALLAARVPGWTTDAPVDGAAAALVRAFARYGALIVERLNRAPDRNRLVFLQHLGAAPRPAQPARAPVTFVLAPGARADVVVPAGTQVATTGDDPVVFETERPLGVSATRLAHVFVKDPLLDRYTEAAALLGDEAVAVAPFTGAAVIPHVGWIGHPDFFGARPLDEVTLTFDIDEAASGGGPGAIAWSAWEGERGVPLRVVEDTTASLSRGGRIRFAGVPLVAATTVHGRTARWLRAEAQGRVAGASPVRSLTMERAVARTGVRLDAAVAGDSPVDVTKDFRPWGDAPAGGEVLLLAQREAFSLPLATVTLTCTASPAASASPVGASGQRLVTWEVWEGASWVVLGTGRSTEDVLNQANGFSDTTRALSRDGTVTFRLPAVVCERTVAGLTNYWVRARLSASAHVEVPGPPPLAPPVAATAPVVHAVTIDYALGGASTSTRPEVVLADNDFQVAEGTTTLRALGDAFALFRRPPGRRAAFYLGFDPPPGQRPPLAPLSVFVAVDEGAMQQSTGRPEPREPLAVWEVASGAAADGTTTWNRLGVRDGTHGVTRSGFVEFLAPRDLALTEEFGRRAWWVRLVRRAPTDDRVPSLRRVRANTVLASQAITLVDEVLGSSTGAPGQVFRTSRGGLLDDPVLEVREPASSDAPGGEAWVRWTEVADFHGSGAFDRHYLLDHDEGAVRFGDGTLGRVPPAGPANVRWRRYRTGGGSRGNVAAGTIVQLRNALPYVERVVNVEAAAGGSDAETASDFARRAATTLRHQDRAVAAEDFEDLARLASPAVARARCLPTTDLAEGLSDGRPGAVSLVIVPRTTDPRPLPSTALLDEVHGFVASRAAPTVRLTVCGPDYVAVDVEADVVVSAFDRVTDADAAIGRAVAAFLDPLRGGPSGAGWEFGRRPHRSDVFALVASTEGVDHVRAVRLAFREARPGVLAAGRFLVCAGTVRMWFYGDEGERP